MSGQAGTLDTTFGTGGKISNNFGGNNLAYDSVLQPDGKIIVVGNTYSIAPGSSFLTVRYLPNGDVDTSFGNLGSATTLIGDHCSAQAVALQSDGKIVVAGSSYAPSGDISTSDIMIVRYNDDGSLDTTFGNNGITSIILNYSQSINTLLIQGNGKIIIGGLFSLLDNPSQDTMGLARFNTDGSLDTTFGTDGYVYTPNIYRGEIMDMKFIDNEDIIAVGRGFIVSNYLMARYTSEGQVVNSFGTNGNGIVQEAYNQIAQLNKCVISSDKDIYIAGATYNGTKYNAFITKYDSNGVKDITFGSDGKILRDFGSTKSSFADDISIDYNNNLILGYTLGATNDYDFGLESYNLDGTLNTSFGSNGYFTTTFGSGHEYFRTMLIQPDNKIVMAGNKGNQVVARVNNTDVLSTNPLNANTDKITIGPNPVNDYTNLTLDMKNSGNMNADLFDSRGVLIAHLIKDKNYMQGTSIENLDLSRFNLSKGLYFLKVAIDSKLNRTIKIIKE